MKRSFLDITYNIGRSTNKVTLSPIDLTDESYWIFGTTDWVLHTLLPEISTSTDLTNKFVVTINQLFIPSKYYIVETSVSGINIKFIKNILPYLLDEADVVVLKGNIRRNV